MICDKVWSRHIRWWKAYPLVGAPLYGPGIAQQGGEGETGGDWAGVRFGMKADDIRYVMNL